MTKPALTSNFHALFGKRQPVIACIHLMALPGSPQYGGNMADVFEQALNECAIYEEHGVDGILIENFRDQPFYPDRIPAETVAALASVGRDIVTQTKLPVGINALRNDAQSALAIATAIEAQFIRVNVHMHAVVADQGLISGRAHETLRLKQNLKSGVQIWADVAVKHATPLGERDLSLETRDLCERGMVDAIIVSGTATGEPTEIKDVQKVRDASSVPVIIGSGTSPENIKKLADYSDGFIIGSYFKEQGKPQNVVEPSRVKKIAKARG